MKFTTLAFICITAGCSTAYIAPNTSAVSSPQTVTVLSTETVVITEGVASRGFQAGTASARDQAIDDALRKAVEQAIGTYISSETQVANFQLISDNIYSRTRGYVSGYTVIDEEESENLYRVTIRAIVKTDNIENDLAAIGLLLEEQGRPRVMVIVKELGNATQLSDVSSLMGSMMFETMILDNFRQQGFPVVDAATLAEIIAQDQLKLILEGDDQTAALLGIEAGAEIVIAGTALHTATSRIIAGTSREIHEYQVSCRAINTRTGSLLAGSAITVAMPFSESQARSRAADSTSCELVSSILEDWIQDENTTVIVAVNADFSRVQNLRSELRSKIRGVLDVVTRDFIGSRATIEVISETSTAEVVDEMTSDSFGVDFEITGMSGNRIEIRFTD